MGGRLEIWRVKLISIKIVVEVEVRVELGNVHRLNSHSLNPKGPS